MTGTPVVPMWTAQPAQLPPFDGLADFLAVEPRCVVETGAKTVGPTGGVAPLGFFECLARGQAMATDLFAIENRSHRIARFWCVPMPEEAVQARIFRQNA
jgi:hypothetical protein